MSRKLRLFATAAALLVGLFGSAVAFAATSSAAEAGHSTAVSANSAQVWRTTSRTALPATARAAVISKAASGVVCPVEVFVSAFQFDFMCIVPPPGQIDIVGFCADGSIVQTGFFGPGTFQGFVFCASGLLQVEFFSR